MHVLMHRRRGVDRILRAVVRAVPGCIAGVAVLALGGASLTPPSDLALVATDDEQHAQESGPTIDDPFEVMVPGRPAVDPPPASMTVIETEEPAPKVDVQGEIGRASCRERV